MSSELTLAQIQAAQSNDLAGIAAVVEHMQDRIDAMASSMAGKRAVAMNSRYTDFRDEYRQEATLALFEYLPRWTGGSVDDFRAFIYQSMTGVMREKFVHERNAGMPTTIMARFKAMVEAADGDLDRAEQMVQTEPEAGERMSAEGARAARLAWEGTISKEVGASEMQWHYDQTDDLDEVRPKVGHGAALEALSVLQRYAGVRVQRMTPGEFNGNLPTLVEALEDSVRVPRDAQQRRYVLDAMAILRSAISTTADGDLAADLREPADDAREVRALRISRVRAALEALGKGQRDVLVYSFGIGGVREYGYGDGCDMEGLAAELGATTANLKAQRSKAKLAFAKAYISLAAKTLEEAAALTAAAAAMRGHGGRK